MEQKVGVGGSRLKPLERKVPRNPKFEQVGPVVNTGKTVKQVEILSNQNVAQRKSELFKRIRPATVAKLLQETQVATESVYGLGGEDEEEQKIDDSVSVVSAAPSVFSVVTVATDQLGLSSDTEFLLMDLRDPEEYAKFHIVEALNFPAPNITRDRMPPELFRFRNSPGKLIVIYAWDERPGVQAAQQFALKGYENVYLISGGVEEFARQYPDLIEGPVKPPIALSPTKSTKSSTSTSRSSFRRG